MSLDSKAQTAVAADESKSICPNETPASNDNATNAESSEADLAPTCDDDLAIADGVIAVLSSHRPLARVDDLNRSLTVGVPDRPSAEHDVVRNKDALTLEVPSTMYKNISTALRLGISKDRDRCHIINVRSGVYKEDLLVLDANITLQARYGHKVTIRPKDKCANVLDIRYPGCKVSGFKIVRTGVGKSYSNKAYCAVASASHVRISDCQFEGGGLWFKQGAHRGLVVEDVSVSGARSHGIYVSCKTPNRTKTEGNFPAYDVSILRCRLARCQGHGLCLQTPAAVLCQQLSITGSGGCGAKLSFGVHADIVWSSINETTGTGIDVDAFNAKKQSSKTDVLVSHCEILRCGKHCVCVGAQSLAQVQNNTFQNSKQEALQMADKDSIDPALIHDNIVLAPTLGKVHQEMVDLQQAKVARALAAEERAKELQKQQALYQKEQNAALEPDVPVSRCPSVMYPTLSKAIECASNEDRTLILIKAGTYAFPKTLVVLKPITLQAAHNQKVVLTTEARGVPVLRIQCAGVVLRDIVVKWNPDPHLGQSSGAGATGGSFKSVLPRLARTVISKTQDEPPLSSEFEPGLMCRMRRGLALGRQSLGIRSFHPAPMTQFRRLKPRRRWTNKRSERLDFLDKSEEGGYFDDQSQANVAAATNRMALVVSVPKTLIERCVFLGGGIWVRGGKDGVSIVDSRVEGGARVGLWMQTEACRARVARTVVRGCSSWGMVCEKRAAPDLVNCTLQGNGAGGAIFRENARGVIRHTQVVANGGDGVRITGRGTDPTVEDSEISDNKGNGVYVEDHGKGTLSRNVLFSQTYHGIALALHDGTVVEENTDKDKIERERREAAELAARQQQEREQAEARAAAEAKAEEDRITRIYGSARGSPKHRKNSPKFRKKRQNKF